MVFGYARCSQICPLCAVAVVVGVTLSLASLVEVGR